MNKTAATAAQLAKYFFLLHAYSRTIARFQLRENKQNFIQLFKGVLNSNFRPLVLN